MAELLHLDDFEAGQVFDLGEHRVTRDEIIEFARQWDPQPFHVDEAAAAQSIYGDLIASGWHTACIFMRLFAENLLNRAAAMGSPGLENLRWLKPVRPGDVLRARLEVLDVKPSRSRADRGIARMRSIVANQEGQDVLSFEAAVIFRRRPEAATA